MSIGGLIQLGRAKIGTWSVHSDLDPRWNKSGRKEWLCSAGYPPEVKAWIKECEAKYGKFPKDATYEFMKD